MIFRLSLFLAFILTLLAISDCLLPPEFQWKVIDYAWQGQHKHAALATGAYIPENNMPTGLARWNNKLFITVPRWKRGVPSSLNYVYMNGDQQQAFNPYPSWGEAFVRDNDRCVSANSSVVSAFRIHVDKCDRLWVVDNGATDIFNNAKQISPPAIFVFDLNTNKLKLKHFISNDLLRDTTVFTSVVVDIVDQDCGNAFAYITDMGSGAILVYNSRNDHAWRLQSPLFQHQANASTYRVGGIDFFWNDGVSSAALSQKNNLGYKDLFCHPTSSTELLRISTRLLRNPDITPEEFHNGVQIVGDKGPLTQATACDYDPSTNVLFYTQLNKNGVGCWNLGRDFSETNTPLVLSDCRLLEFPNDIKVDADGNVWILSNRQSRFLYGNVDIDQVNYRILKAPAAKLIQGSRCQLHTIEKVARFFHHSKL